MMNLGDGCWTVDYHNGSYPRWTRDFLNQKLRAHRHLRPLVFIATVGWFLMGEETTVWRDYCADTKEGELAFQPDDLMYRFMADFIKDFDLYAWYEDVAYGPRAGDEYPDMTVAAGVETEMIEVQHNRGYGGVRTPGRRTAWLEIAGVRRTIPTGKRSLQRLYARAKIMGEPSPERTRLVSDGLQLMEDMVNKKSPIRRLDFE